MSACDVKQQLLALGNPEKANHLKRFFKTGAGQYGEGDVFVGVTAPELRGVAANNKNISFQEVEKLLHDEVHECRSCALVILVNRFQKSGSDVRDIIAGLYLSNTRYINNWDLVDISAHKIIGEWLLHKDRILLYDLAQSNLLWDQRIAMVATFAFIRKGDFDDTLQLSERFLTHRHDLMHKASGWMLREVGKRDELTLTEFLDKHHKTMPRTMLRYAIEKLSSEQKRNYMKK